MIYIVEFQQYTRKLNQNNTSKQAQFYKGLKDRIKDNITITRKLDELDNLIKLAIKIDAQRYEQQLKKQEYYFSPSSKTKK